jgi:hypothetical protein
VVDDGGLVDGSEAKASLVGGLVEDHSVLHVVSGVGDDGDDGVHPVGEEVHAVLVVEVGSDDGRLTGLESVLKGREDRKFRQRLKQERVKLGEDREAYHLVVRTSADSGRRGTHRLLSHLTLEVRMRS